MSSIPLEVVLKRDRLLVLGGLVIISALAWGYLFHQAHGMQPMNMDSMNMSGMDMTGMDKRMSMAMPQPHTWGTLDLLLIFTMWAVMMVAMMVPTTAPKLLGAYEYSFRVGGHDSFLGRLDCRVCSARKDRAARNWSMGQSLRRSARGWLGSMDVGGNPLS